MNLEGLLSGNTLGFARFIVPRSSRNALNLIRFPINFDKCHMVCLQIVNHRYLTLRFISLRKGKGYYFGLLVEKSQEDVYLPYFSPQSGGEGIEKLTLFDAYIEVGVHLLQFWTYLSNFVY